METHWNLPYLELSKTLQGKVHQTNEWYLEIKIFVMKLKLFSKLKTAWNWEKKVKSLKFKTAIAQMIYGVEKNCA